MLKINWLLNVLLTKSNLLIKYLKKFYDNLNSEQ